VLGLRNDTQDFVLDNKRPRGRWCDIVLTEQNAQGMLVPCSSESFVFPLLSENLKIKIYKTTNLSDVLYGVELSFSRWENTH
jgi:hypothetical protein